MLEHSSMYVELMTYSHEAAASFLKARKPTENVVIGNAVTAMMMVLATSANCASVLETTMPHSLEKVDKNILAFEVIAYATCTLQQAAHTRHRRERNGTVERAWHQLMNAARIIKEFFIEK